MRRLIFLLIIVSALASCTDRSEYRAALSRAQDVIETDPDSALKILDTLGLHSDDFSRHFRMQFLLSETYAEAKTGLLFRTDSLTRILVSYFDNNGSREEQALAYYMHGCALSDIGQAPEALQAYYDAIERIDTTKSDCNYQILRGVYGQMSQIFHHQNLPQDEIRALNHYIDCVRRTSSEEDYIIAKGQLVRPYYLLGEKDKVLEIITDEYQSLKNLGKNREAATELVPAIYIYTERGKMKEAASALDIVEQESEIPYYQDEVRPGYEGYYYVKGYFDLASGRLDSAEKWFRKSIEHGYLSEGYRGLLHIYREKSVMDSVFRFSVMYEAAQDSLHNRMQTEAIHQMAAMYNYTRSQKEAELTRAQFRKSRQWAVFIAVIVFVLIYILFLHYSRKTKIRKQKIADLERRLEEAQTKHNEISEELSLLKSQDYQGVIAAKEAKLAKLSEIIKQLHEENKKYKESKKVSERNNLDEFMQSEIAKHFLALMTEKPTEINITEREWKTLVSKFKIHNPSAYKKFCSGKGLSQLELRICILLIMDIPNESVINMTDSMPSTVSNAKSRANEKLFGIKVAQSLKSNLKRYFQA